MQNQSIFPLKLEVQHREKRDISENSIITISSDTESQGIFTSQSQSSSRKIIKKKKNIKKFIRSSKFKSQKKRSRRIIKISNNSLIKIKEQTEIKIEKLLAQLLLQKNEAIQLCKKLLKLFSKYNPVFDPQDKITKEKHDKNLQILENCLENMVKYPNEYEELIDLLRNSKLNLFLRKCLKYDKEKHEKSEAKLTKKPLLKKRENSSKKEIKNIVFTLEQIKTLKIYFENIKEINENHINSISKKVSFFERELFQQTSFENPKENRVETFENRQKNEISAEKPSQKPREKEKSNDFFEENAKENVLDEISEKQESFEGFPFKKKTNKYKLYFLEEEEEEKINSNNEDDLKTRIIKALKSNKTKNQAINYEEKKALQNESICFLIIIFHESKNFIKNSKNQIKKKKKPYSKL